MTASSTTIATATNEQPKPVETRKRRLLCPVCVKRAKKDGKTAEAVETLVTFIWVPDVRDLKQFGDRYSDLLETITPRNGGQPFDQARNVCNEDGRKLRTVKLPDDPKRGIRTYQLSGILDRAAERRQERDRSEIEGLFDVPTPHEASIGSMIGSESESEIRKAVPERARRRTPRRPIRSIEPSRDRRNRGEE